jgi:hypothetical protein
MSKNSPKQNVVQLKEWLATRKGPNTSSTSSTNQSRGKFSKADHYKKANQRHGN